MNFLGIPLTEQDYVAKLGLACPSCYTTEDVETDGRVQATDDGVAWQDALCNTCGATWIDNYTLVGYSQLNTYNSPPTDTIGMEGDQW